MRLFFGLPIPEDLRLQLQSLQKSLESSLPERAFRWTRPELFHVTLAFLGEVPEGHVQQLDVLAKKICANFKAQDLEFTRFGAFPNARSPKVLWVGCDDTQPAVQSLSQLGTELSRECGPFGDAKVETQVVLHVTLARSNRGTAPQTSKQIQALFAAEPLGQLSSAPITEAILYQSTLNEGPTRYVPLGRFPLNA